MRQILQDLRTGETLLEEIPSPGAVPGHLTMSSVCSLVSTGTERMLLDFARAGLLEKARQQPEKVRMLMDKVRADGFLTTVEAVRNKLSQPIPLGYCNVGRVTAVGQDVAGYSIGDRVASNGNHAEVVCVPKNLCAKVPPGVSDDEAAFAIVGAIALQGIRLAKPTLGEAVAVFGLGLIGQLTVQLLRANGCRVIGFDLDASKLAMAQRFGAETFDLSGEKDPLSAASHFSRGRGIDAVIIATATRSNLPIAQAAGMSRKRGRIVLIGTTGLELARSDFYDKELTFQVSCSYGPGRYDHAYEQRGHDYPVGFVRWTEQRNMEAVLDMIVERRLNVAPLISHRIAFAEAPKAYVLISGDEPSLGVLLEYAQPAEPSPAWPRTVLIRGRGAAKPDGGNPRVAFIGSGSYANSSLIPAFRGAGAALVSVASKSGVSSAIAARRYGFETATTDSASILNDPDIDAIVIATRHDSHAGLVIAALEAGKSVFVEKPLAIRADEVDAIERAWHSRAASEISRPLLMVGFNRRFAPHVVKIKSLLGGIKAPKAFVMTVNAGSISSEHWTQIREIGGGRIIGEACHFIDLLRFLSGAAITSSAASFLGEANRDTATLTLGFADGSIGTIHYFANGNRAFAKERLEVYAAGRIIRMDNYRRLEAAGWPHVPKMRSWRQDKGHAACAEAFISAVRMQELSPISPDELFEVARVTIRLADGE